MNTMLFSMLVCLAAACVADPSIEAVRASGDQAAFGRAIEERFSVAARSARGINKHNATRRQSVHASPWYEHEHTSAIHADWEFWSRAVEAWRILCATSEGALLESVIDRHPFDGTRRRYVDIYSAFDGRRSYRISMGIAA